MNRFKSYFKNIKNILIYFDYQTLLFWWCISDCLNNQVLWTNYSYWLELGQPNTYWLYFVYLLFSSLIVISLNNLNWLVKFVGCYLILYLFSTVRYVVDIVVQDDFQLVKDFRALLITGWYFSMWLWIYFKLKKEKLHKSLNKSRYYYIKDRNV
jgi:hypothetical protein